MANPQLENGYVRVANEIWDEVIRRDFSKRQKDILFFIWRLSYGCRKKTAYIPKLVYFELCGVRRNHIKEELLFLVEARVLIWNQEDKTFEVNKDYEQWQVTPVKGWKEYRFDEILSLNLEESSQNRNKNIPETGTKKFPKQELLEGDQEEKFPKQELSSSQNGNIFDEKVPETGTSTVVEPLSGAASGAPKDIIKDSIKNSSSTKLLSSDQETEPQAPATGPDLSFGGLYEIFAKFFASDPSKLAFESEDFGDLFDTYGGEWLYQAFREASRHQVYKLPYVEKILKGYKERGRPGKERAAPGTGTAQSSYVEVDKDDPDYQRMLQADFLRQREAQGVGGL